MIRKELVNKKRSSTEKEKFGMRKQFLQAFEKIILFFHFLHEFSFYMTEIFRRHAVTHRLLSIQK